MSEVHPQITQNGTLFSTGANYEGELGYAPGSSTDYRIVTWAGSSTASTVACFAYDSCVVDAADNSVWCAGSHGSPAASTSGAVPARGFVRVLGSSFGVRVAQLSVGYSHSCATYTNGTALCWGMRDAFLPHAASSDGQTFVGPTPVVVPQLGGAAPSQVVAGYETTFVVSGVFGTLYGIGSSTALSGAMAAFNASRDVTGFSRIDLGGLRARKRPPRHPRATSPTQTPRGRRRRRRRRVSLPLGPSRGRSELAVAVMLVVFVFAVSLC